MTPPAGESGPVSMAAAPVIWPWTIAAARAMLLPHSLANDPSAPGGRPWARAARDRSTFQRAARSMATSWAARCLTMGSADAPVSRARLGTRSARPARWGYQM